MSDSSEQDTRLTGLLGSVVTSASDAVLITDADSLNESEGGPRIVYANEAFARMTGYAPDEVVGRTPRLLQCEDTDAKTLRRIRTALERWEPVEAELLNRRKNGRDFWVQISVAPALDGNGTCTHWVSIQRDITDRRDRELRDEQRLRSAQERLRGAFGHAPIGMAVAAPDGRLLEVNPSLAHLLGYEVPQLIGTTLFDVTHVDDRAAADLACRTLNERGGTGRQERRLVTADGTTMDVVVHSSLVTDPDGLPDHIIMHIEDVSERNALQGELSRRALSDALTQLPNRAMLLDRLAQATARRNRDASSLALLFTDIDGFKDVNDTFGHAEGDNLLVAVARRLQEAVRPGDTVARFGGDEFVVLCEHTTRRESEAIAARLVAAADVVHQSGDGSLRTSISAGLVVVSGPAHVAPESLLADADTAMYEAKRNGRGRAVRFEPRMRARDGQRRAAERELREALDNGEFFLHYQPQIDLGDAGLCGVEALVRWDHPQRGLVGPGEFIALAERTGIIVPLGAWVTEAACAEAASSRMPFVMWVNVSAHQLRAGFVEDIRQVLERTGLPAGRLGLELTESVLLENLQNARVQLAELQRLGVQLALDDFGTGYSSLAYLAELPVTTVKVDRSFTARLQPGGRGRLVTTAVLGMARALGLRVVVEGVETDEQLDILREIGVDVVQGFLLGRPAPALPTGAEGLGAV